MDIDTATLRLAFVVIAVTMVFLFYFVTYRSTRSAYCGWWCVALLLFLAGSAAYLLDGTPQQWWANPSGSVLSVLGATSAWAAARSLRTTAPAAWQMITGPVLVAVWASTDSPGTNDWAGGGLYLFMVSAMLGLTAVEMWRLDHGRRAVTTALMLIASLAGGFYFFRFVVFIITGPDSFFFTTYAGSELATLINTMLLVTVAYGMAALSNDQSISELRRRATHDGLTNLLNRNEFLSRAEAELRHARRTGATASLILADLDHFKEVNDTYGHQMGDRVLEAFASMCRATVRSTDLVGRYGGEEYVLFLTGSDVDDAEAITLKIRRSMSTVPFAEGLSPSASYGVAAIGHTATLADIIGSADAALYLAKAGGRDRTVIAGRSPTAVVDDHEPVTFTDTPTP